MARPHKRPDVPERPITFQAAEDLGAFELAQLWIDRAAWPVDERSAYDELAELATMSALATWLARWLPIAIHGAMRAGAKPDAVAAALGADSQATYELWHDWALRQRAILGNGKPGIPDDEYEIVKRRFTEMSAAHLAPLQGVQHVPGRYKRPQCRRPRRAL
jgi:hypothetical protein